MTLDDLPMLACPRCRAPLALTGSLAHGTLHCTRCDGTWPTRDGIPNFIQESDIRGMEWFIRMVYDLIAPLHDLSVTYALPLMQGSSEAASRDGYMQRLDLASLAHTVRQRPARILDIGIGGGGNLPFLERHLPPGLDAEIWGIDLSEGMLAQCRQRVRRGTRPVRLLLGDAHDLPFATASFDRVYHVGGIATYRDPARALLEMARVARPNTPIVVVDEQLDPAVRFNPYYRFVFRAMTAYDLDPRAPTQAVPPDALDVREEQISNFYYCLSFRMPAPHAADPTEATIPT